MSEVFIKIIEVPAPFNVAIIAVVMGIGMAVIGVVAGEIRKFATHRLDLDAKRDLLEQGMDPDEIDRVLRAGRGKKK